MEFNINGLTQDLSKLDPITRVLENVQFSRLSMETLRLHRADETNPSRWYCQRQKHREREREREKNNK